MSSDWNARQYLKFEDERTRPARDLLDQVPLTAARSVVDLGCGPANSTELLAVRYPEAEVTGIDNSPDMLVAARRRLPHATFIQADVAQVVLDARADLIFANAVLQWVPDHARLMPRLIAQVVDGGILAVQMPDNLDEPAHVAAREVAEEGPWWERLADAVAARTVLPPLDAYYDLLIPHATKVSVWKTIYYHPLADAAAIMEWMKGTGLRPFIDPLGPDERAAYLSAYQQRIAQYYPRRADGRVLLAFPRIFLLAQR